MKHNLRTSEEDRILDALLVKHEELPPELVRRLLDLVKEQFPNLNTYGAKKHLTRKIRQILDSAAIRQEISDV